MYPFQGMANLDMLYSFDTFCKQTNKQKIQHVQFIKKHFFHRCLKTNSSKA